MNSTRRIWIILLGVAAFMGTTIFIGISIGLSFNQTVTFLTLGALAMTYSVGTEQILRWTEKEEAASSQTNESISNAKTSQSTPKVDTPETNPDYSATENSIYTSYKRDKKWRQYHDSSYESTRLLSKFASRMGSLVYRVPIFTERRVWIGIAFVMFLGLASSIIAMSEQMMQFGVESQFWKDIASTFSVRFIEANPTLAIVVSLFVSVLPLGYLTSKQNMTCDYCGEEFSLRSLGRFYHGKWGKEPIPITNEEGNQVDQYYEYEGYRVLECEECGRQYDIETKWDNRGERL